MKFGILILSLVSALSYAAGDVKSEDKSVVLGPAFETCKIIEENHEFCLISQRDHNKNIFMYTAIKSCAIHAPPSTPE